MIETLAKLENTRVLVVGDLMLDRYYWGEVNRVSPEAPVPVVKVGREETRLGGAANVANNLAALGCKVWVCGLTGVDDMGREVRRMLGEIGADTSAVLSDPARPTGVKLRILAQHQQMLRCDWEQAAPLGEKLLGDLLARLEPLMAKVDGVIVSDYGKGLITRGLMEALLALAGRHGRKVTVDPKGMDYSRYKGAACLTPNEHEASMVTHQPILNDQDALTVARRLMDMCALESVCVTRGAKGVLTARKSGEWRQLAAQAREVYDVTGAGDTFISLFSALLFAGVEPFECVRLANLGAGIVVGKLGTATVTTAEILSQDGHPFRFHTLHDIGETAERLRQEGKRIVFTNGCFDLLHAGHIQYLKDSKARGDVLIVGLNSDDSVRRLKGPTRPVIGEEDRAHVLGALEAVDHVVIFGEDTPLEVIKRVRPHVLTKGADYTVDQVVGADLMAQWGGVVELIPLKENRSTSGIIRKITAQENTPADPDHPAKTSAPGRKKPKG
ncbi:MAG: D-glycero-beta-D-manno-heptose-7-phosphate kinase [Deltaproteobacteria bacterium]|nr:D-glycero-beta-D-manno-heptose-7-phosphate kinase [Deltaproteobacteria bacterium]